MLLLPMSAPSASDGNIQLQIKPDKCVAMRRGQVCFQRLRFSIDLPDTGEYCLHRESDEPLQCWKNSSSVKYTYELKSDKTVVFYLYHNKKKVAEKTVTVAWVYNNKSRRRNSWRLF